MAGTGGTRHLRREFDPDTLEPDRERGMARRAAGAWQLHTDSVGQSHIRDTGGQAAESPDLDVLRAVQRQAALAIGRFLWGNRADAPDESVRLTLSRDGW